jgi:hypothetical protein
MKTGAPMPRLVIGVVIVLGIAAAAAGQEVRSVAFQAEDGRILIRAGEQPIAQYVLRDETTPRPYFAHLRTLDGVQVTRNHPPREDDLKDHDTFHPGLWMAFGDLSGADHWRLQAKVVHERFVEEPQGGAGRGAFTVENLYLTERGDATICRELRRLEFHILPAGWLLAWDSTFSSAAGDFAFGDQEEMGLGVRVATPLAVVSGRGGRILDAQGNRNEAQARGKIAPWCDYSGPLAGRLAGVTLCSHPENFRPSWHHVRDYGLMVANPFGRRALTCGEESRVAVKQGDTLRLRFGVFVYAAETAQPHDPEDAYRAYVRLAPSALSASP